MTREQAEEVVIANRVLYPMDFLKFEECDFSTLAMLYVKALGKYDFEDVKEAFVECSKTCQHCVKVSDMYAKLSRLHGRDGLAMQKLVGDEEDEG